jgi:thiol-disulfide isomerase/thioredoxin
MFEQSNDTTYVFNFWATWCSPCVNEFPEFQKLSSAYANKKIRFIFISLDFKKDFETALTPFVKKHDVKNDVFLLDEPDYNVWINKVDPSWNGDIPMTLVINNKMKIRNMYAREFTYDELEKTIRPIIQ